MPVRQAPPEFSTWPKSQPVGPPQRGAKLRRFNRRRSEGLMGLFNLFGGKKKAAPAPVKAVPAPPVTSISAPAPARTNSTAVAQVKLRLKLAHALRTGERDAAFEAAEALAAIQAEAGRRTQARVWREEAERIAAGA